MIGIISDTHDNVWNIIKAVELFKKRSVKLVIHCGDICAPGTIRFFEGLEVWFIKGNCDGDIPMIEKKSAEFGCKYLGISAEFEIDGKKFAVTHGNKTDILKNFISSGKYDYVLYGHFHQTEDKKEGKTRVINPGAQYYGAENTIVFLEPSKDEVEFVKLDGNLSD